MSEAETTPKPAPLIAAAILQGDGTWSIASRVSKSITQAPGIKTREEADAFNVQQGVTESGLNELLDYIQTSEEEDEEEAQLGEAQARGMMLPVEALEVVSYFSAKLGRT